MPKQLRSKPNEFVIYRAMFDETSFKVHPSDVKVAGEDHSVLAMHGHLAWKATGEPLNVPVHEQEVCIPPACMYEKTSKI